MSEAKTEQSKEKPVQEKVVEKPVQEKVVEKPAPTLAEMNATARKINERIKNKLISK